MAAAADPAPPGLPKGMGKMAIIIPVMLYARKLDGEDPDTVTMLRLIYGVVQVLCFAMLGYMFSLSSAAADDTTTVLIPPKPGPFDDPAAPKKYKTTCYGDLYVEQVRALFGSSAMSIAMTCGLHYYKGMVMGLAIQSVMAPFNLYEHPCFQRLVLGNKGRVFDEVLEEEWKPEMGTIEGEEEESSTKKNTKAIGGGGKKKKGTPSATTIGKSSKPKVSPIEEIILDTWDDGSKADLGPLLGKVTEANVNLQTSESRWTPLMVVCGLNTKSSKSAMIQLNGLGASPSVKDTEGWNALHWACFHNNATAVQTLMDEKVFDCGAFGLQDVKDLKGDTPLALATKEGNKEAEKALKAILAEAKKDN